VITAKDVASIYEVPLVFAQEEVDTLALKYLRMEARDRDLTRWQELVHRVYNPKDTVDRDRRQVCGVRGFVQVTERSAGTRRAGAQPEAECDLGGSGRAGDGRLRIAARRLDGILVPGGFGKRGIAGMLNAIRYARENKVPYFGICLGMQTACIEFARDVCKLEGAIRASSTGTAHRIIYKLRELRGIDELGGTMRLGAWECKLEPGSHAAEAYGTLEISERHRHRYEFNREYEALLCGAGLKITGSTPDGTYVEIVELDRDTHPYFLGCQFHPEFKSKPLERIRCSRALWAPVMRIA
jgi:CTP synthase